MLVEPVRAFSLDLGQRLLAALIVDVAQRELRATLGEGASQNTPEPLRGPRNHHDPVFEIEYHLVSASVSIPSESLIVARFST